MNCQPLLGKTERELLETIAHEMRNPLTSIQGFIDLLVESNSNWTKTQLESIEVINRNLHRLNVLSTRILTCSKLENSSTSLNIEYLGINHLLNSVVKEIRFQIKQKSLSFHINSFEDFEIQGDKEYIRIAFNNLISNAIKYTPEGGTIRIEISRTSSKVLVSISDTGIGLSEYEMHHIFEKFFKLQRNCERSIGRPTGFGLGLYITHKIITRHGGKIWAESNGVNRGARFSFELPLKPL